MVNVYDALQEYLVVDGQLVQMQSNVAEPSTSQPSTSQIMTRRNSPTDIADYKWGSNETKALISLYGQYKSKVGTLKIKTIKQMCQKIVEELAKLSILVTLNNCMNRWKVLERNYKKFVDNQNKTGRGRKYFEYQAEMEEIFGKKKNVHPEILLATETVDNTVPTTELETVECAGEGAIIPVEGSPKKRKAEITTPTTPKRKFILKKSEASKRKTSVLEEMRRDRKKYYEDKIELERNKLEEIRTRNRLIVERNELIREQNQLLKEGGCKCKCPNNMG